VAFQERSFAIKDEMRALATKNEQEIQQISEDGRHRLAALLSNPPASKLQSIGNDNAA